MREAWSILRHRFWFITGGARFLRTVVKPNTCAHLETYAKRATMSDVQGYRSIVQSHDVEPRGEHSITDEYVFSKEHVVKLNSDCFHVHTCSRFSRGFGNDQFDFPRAAVQSDSVNKHNRRRDGSFPSLLSRPSPISYTGSNRKLRAPCNTSRERPLNFKQSERCLVSDFRMNHWTPT